MRRLLAVTVAAVLLAGLTPAAFAQGPQSLTYGERYLSTITSAAPSGDHGNRFELWTFDGEGRTCVELRMETPAFEPYLYLAQGTPSGPAIAEGPGRLRLHLPSSGRYFVKATASGGPDSLGPYVISLARC